jgi:hypothetical protein
MSPPRTGIIGQLGLYGHAGGKIQMPTSASIHLLVDGIGHSQLASSVNHCSWLLATSHKEIADLLLLLIWREIDKS